VQITHVHNFERFSPCGFLPSFVGLVLDNALELSSDIPFEILFGTEFKLVADLMRVNILDPYRVNDGINHLSYGAFTDYLVLNVLLLAILKADIGKYNIKRSFWH
jgi:hypothetical protein